jgi:hypothetical protein
VTGELSLLIIYMIKVPKLIKVFSEVHSSLFCTMMSYIGELLKTLLLKCLGDDQAKMLWERFMKAFVVSIN